MQYKIICSDIDGTLLDKNRSLSEATIHEVKRIKDRVPFILVSARMPAAMKYLQEALDIPSSPLICYNGALVYVYNEAGGSPEILHSLPIDSDIPGELLQHTQDSEVHISLYRFDEWFVPSMDYWARREQNNTRVDPEVADLHAVAARWESEGIGPHKIMCMGPVDAIGPLEDFLRENYSDRLQIYRSKDTYIEVSSKSISKASAIEKLLQNSYQLGLDAAMAFGDNYNDVEMLQLVGCGIAVANARPEALEVADDTTLSNVEDGVAVALRKYFPE